MVVLVFLCLPSLVIFFELSSEVFLAIFQIVDFFIANFDLFLLKFDSLLQFNDEIIFFSIFLFETFNFGFELSGF